MGTNMKDRQPEKITLSAFEDILKNHKWTFNEQDNFHDYIRDRHEEKRLFKLAMENGPDFVKSYYYAQINNVQKYIDKAVHKVQLEKSDYYDKMILTGNDEFDEFRKKLDYFDWYYDYSDDGGVARRGHERYLELKKTAETKGGLFFDLWKLRCKYHSERINKK